MEVLVGAWDRTLKISWRQKEMIPEKQLKMGVCEVYKIDFFDKYWEILCKLTRCDTGVAGRLIGLHNEQE